MLEVKLFIKRHPEVRGGLRQIDEQVGDSIERALTRLFALVLTGLLVGLRVVG
jgi:hypothetical protein